MPRVRNTSRLAIPTSSTESATPYRLSKKLHHRFPDLTYDITVKIEHLLKNGRYLRLLRDTGCALVTTAVESLDNRVLALLDKGHTVDDFFEVVELFKRHRLVMNPTFIPFTPWITLEGYARFLNTLAELDLIEHVSPVQLTIRLLFPGESRLLELAEVRNLVGPFTPEALLYPWAHPDARLDRLQNELTRLVARLQKSDAPPARDLPQDQVACARDAGPAGTKGRYRCGPDPPIASPPHRTLVLLSGAHRRAVRSCLT